MFVPMLRKGTDVVGVAVDGDADADADAAADAAADADGEYIRVFAAGLF